MHSLALTADHEVYSTGVNDEGALGRYTGECACLAVSFVPHSIRFSETVASFLQRVKPGRGIQAAKRQAMPTPGARWKCPLLMGLLYKSQLVIPAAY